MIDLGMHRFPTSIRQKITLGYYIAFSLMIAAALLIYTDLMTVEKKIMFGEIISEFFDTTLEMRRFEKNYFLYKKPEDYDENLKLINRAKGLLEKNKADFQKLASINDVYYLENVLQEYSILMNQYRSIIKSMSAPSDIIEAKIRDKGKEIVEIAERILAKERSIIKNLLSTSRYILILSFAVLVLIGIALGQILTKMVVKPLKKLEEGMKRISEGNFVQFSIEAADKEIIALNESFKKMCTHIFDELEQRHKQLIQAEKLAALGTLLSGVAHELNNPLSNISSSCQILMEELKQGHGSWVKGQEKEKPAPIPLPLDPHFIMELLSQIDDQTDRARNIVRSLLDFSREQASEKRHLPLKKLLEETMQFIHGEMSGKVDVSLDVDDEIKIFADRQRMQQAFLNIIKNSIEALYGEGRVAIKAAKNPVNNMVEIEVHDTGIGIRPENISKIFDPFFTTKDVGKGSGLGLFITYEIIKNHGGDIKAESASNKGTTFIIRLPSEEI